MCLKQKPSDYLLIFILNQAAGDIVADPFVALNATISIDKDMPNCKIVATSRIYDTEAENIFGEGFLSLQVQVSQRVDITSKQSFGLEQVTSLVEAGFDVTTGGHTLFRTLLLDHPLFHTIIVVKVRRSLADPQVPSTLMPSLSSNPTPVPTFSSVPSDLPSLVPSKMPSITPSSHPSNSPSLHPTSMPSRKPSSQPSISPSTRPSSGPTSQPSAAVDTDISVNDSNHALPDGGGEYRLNEDPFAIAAIVGGLTAIFVSSICFLWFRYHRKVGVVRHRPDALTTRDGQSKHDGSSIVPPEIVELDQQSLADTTLGDLTAIRNRTRRKSKRHSVQPILPIDSIDENSLYTSPLSLKMDNASSRHSRTSNLSSPGNGPLDYEVAALFPLSTASRKEYSDNFDTDTPGDNAHQLATRPRLKQLRGIGSIDLDSHGTKSDTTKNDTVRAKKVSQALGQQSQHSSMWGYDTDWSYNSEGSKSSRRSCSSRRSRSSWSSYRGTLIPASQSSRSTKVGIRDQERGRDVSQSSYNSTIRQGRENNSSHNKSLDGTESSLVVSHISDKDFMADMQSVESRGSASSATSSRSYSSRSARQGGALADFLESMIKAKGPYRSTSIPPLTPEGEEFDPDLEDSPGTSKESGSDSSPSSSEDTSSSPLSTGEGNEIHSGVETSAESSDRMESDSSSDRSDDTKSRYETEQTVSKVKVASNASSPAGRKAGEGRNIESPESSAGSSPSQPLTLLKVQNFEDSMDGPGRERGENDLRVAFSKDDDSASSDSTGKSPRTWLLDTVEQTLGPRSLSADMESLGGRSSRSNRVSPRRSSTGKERSIGPRVLEQEKKRLEMQLSSLDNDQLTISSVGAASVTGSFCTMGSRSRAAKISRKKRIVVLVPPGKLGVVLANRRGNKGTMIAEIRRTSVLHRMISQGDRLVAVDGEDVTGMTISQITALMASKANLERRLTILTSVLHQQP
jgi:hypothetical protein